MLAFGAGDSGSNPDGTAILILWAMSISRIDPKLNTNNLAIAETSNVVENEVTFDATFSAW